MKNRRIHFSKRGEKGSQIEGESKSSGSGAVFSLLSATIERIVKEKNALAERLKNAEAARKIFDELKRYATETISREEVRQSLEDEVRRLTQTVGQTEGEKREKEEQVARCEAYMDGVEAKLHACQGCGSMLVTEHIRLVLSTPMGFD